MGVRAMRRATSSPVLGLLCAAALTGASIAQAQTWVYLDGAADLEHLRETNLDHYLRARKILAAANEICRAGREETHFARFEAADPHCGNLWKTSFPPKKLLSFRLDDIHYVALVTVTANPGKAVKIGGATGERSR